MKLELLGYCLGYILSRRIYKLIILIETPHERSAFLVLGSLFDFETGLSLYKLPILSKTISSGPNQLFESIFEDLVNFSLSAVGPSKDKAFLGCQETGWIAQELSINTLQKAVKANRDNTIFSF